MEERGPEVAAATEMVAKCVLDHDQEVSEKAVRALGKIRSPAAIPILSSRLSSGVPRIRAAAAQALGEIAAEAESVLPELRRLLKDNEDAVRVSAMDAIGSFESRAAGLSNEFWPILKEGMLQCDYSRFGPAIYALRRIIPSPHETIQSFIANFDRAMQIVALEVLNEEPPVEQPSPLYLP